ncbi:MBL fold metallo-hydrolase [uncultured Croceitalea sp.]|uniref:MBL fold metallo-hydrolase n=1 Tax=uncultured Croceitalea sp. TaxID=1798908 RepID=UPI0033062AF9
MKKLFLITFLFVFIGCNSQSKEVTESKVSVLVLGTVQDAGSPHIGCKKECCAPLFLNPDKNRKVVSLGLIDYENNKTFLFEATPDLPTQLKLLKERAKTEVETPNGIFLTHAHIGHYTGLMYLGREAMGAKDIPVYAMPKMKAFLEQNGPWSQLVDLNNISIKDLVNNHEVKLTNNLSVIPFLVPHRDEFSETVGFKIVGPNKSLLFIPDIDKWSKWEKNIIDEIRNVDYAFLDATFFDGEEINNRSISEIPHPFIIESMELFKGLSDAEKEKVHFIHFNHTNPVLNLESKKASIVLKHGFHIANFGQNIRL